MDYHIKEHELEEVFLRIVEGGIPIAFLFSQNFLSSFYPPLFKVLPWTLAVPLNNSQAPSIAVALMTGAPVLSYLPLYTTLAASVIFVAIALRAFQKQEL